MQANNEEESIQYYNNKGFKVIGNSIEGNSFDSLPSKLIELYNSESNENTKIHWVGEKDNGKCMVLYGCTEIQTQISQRIQYPITFEQLFLSLPIQPKDKRVRRVTHTPVCTFQQFSHELWLFVREKKYIAYAEVLKLLDRGVPKKTMEHYIAISRGENHESCSLFKEQIILQYPDFNKPLSNKYLDECCEGIFVDNGYSFNNYESNKEVPSKSNFNGRIKRLGVACLFNCLPLMLLKDDLITFLF